MLNVEYFLPVYLLANAAIALGMMFIFLSGKCCCYRSTATNPPGSLYFQCWLTKLSDRTGRLALGTLTIGLGIPFLSLQYECLCYLPPVGEALMHTGPYPFRLFRDEVISSPSY